MQVLHPAVGLTLPPQGRDQTFDIHTLVDRTEGCEGTSMLKQDRVHVTQWQQSSTLRAPRSLSRARASEYDLRINHQGPAPAHGRQQAVLGREVVCREAHNVPLAHHNRVRKNAGQGELGVHWYTQGLRRGNPLLHAAQASPQHTSREAGTSGSQSGLNMSYNWSPQPQDCRKNQCHPTCTS